MIKAKIKITICFSYVFKLNILFEHFENMFLFFLLDTLYAKIFLKSIHLTLNPLSTDFFFSCIFITKEALKLEKLHCNKGVRHLVY